MKVISRKKVAHLLYHVVDGYACSQKGINKLLADGMISAKEYQHLMAMNLNRLEEKLHEWRVAEKMLAIAFAVTFGFMAFTSSIDDDIRRGSRSKVRTARVQRSGKHSEI